MSYPLKMIHLLPFLQKIEAGQGVWSPPDWP